MDYENDDFLLRDIYTVPLGIEVVDNKSVRVLRAWCPLFPKVISPI